MGATVLLVHGARCGKWCYWNGPVVVVGKSYGGAVVSAAAADRPNVAHLVYVAAFIPEPGEPFQQTTASARQPEVAAGIRRLDDGRVEVDAEAGRAARSRTPAWQSIESTYVVCSEDRCIDPAAQRQWAARATHVIERPYDHSPGVSHPDEIAHLLTQIATGAAL